MRFVEASLKVGFGKSLSFLLLVFLPSPARFAFFPFFFLSSFDIFQGLSH